MNKGTIVQQAGAGFQDILNFNVFSPPNVKSTVGRMSHRQMVKVRLQERWYRSSSLAAEEKRKQNNWKRFREEMEAIGVNQSVSLGGWIGFVSLSKPDS